MEKKYFSGHKFDYVKSAKLYEFCLDDQEYEDVLAFIKKICRHLWA